MGRFLHVSVQRGQRHAIHISKITMKRLWVVGGLYINEISFVQLIGLYLSFDIFPVLHTQTAPPPPHLPSFTSQLYLTSSLPWPEERATIA